MQWYINCFWLFLFAVHQLQPCIYKGIAYTHIIVWCVEKLYSKFQCVFPNIDLHYYTAVLSTFATYEHTSMKPQCTNKLWLLKFGAWETICSTVQWCTTVLKVGTRPLTLHACFLPNASSIEAFNCTHILYTNQSPEHTQFFRGLPQNPKMCAHAYQLPFQTIHAL